MKVEINSSFVTDQGIVTLRVWDKMVPKSMQSNILADSDRYAHTHTCVWGICMWSTICWQWFTYLKNIFKAKLILESHCQNKKNEFCWLDAYNKFSQTKCFEWIDEGCKEWVRLFGYKIPPLMNFRPSWFVTTICFRRGCRAVETHRTVRKPNLTYSSGKVSAPSGMCHIDSAIGRRQTLPKHNIASPAYQTIARHRPI